MARAIVGATVSYPEHGALRVHPRPWHVRPPERSLKRGPNRFDDPHDQYPVRYLAEHLSTCLLEVMARFRGNGEADDLLDAMTSGLDDPDLDDLVDPVQEEGVRDFLAENKVGVFRPPPGTRLDRLVNVSNPHLLAALDVNHRIRQQLRRPEVVAAFGVHGAVHLDRSLIHNANSEVGRPVTQEISWLLFDVMGMQGLRYYSRHNDGDQSVCWALHGEVHLDMKPAEHLDPANDDHRAAVQYVSDLYDLPLPLAWAAPVAEPLTA